MGLLSNVLLFPITGPVHGFEAVLRVIQAQVEAEQLSEGQVQAQLLQLDLRHRAGQIDDAEYQAEQKSLLQTLNQLRAYRQQASRQEQQQREAEMDAGGSGP